MASHGPQRSGRLAALLLAALVAAVYAPSLRNDFLYDDHEVILAQPRPGSAADLLGVFAEPHFRGLPYYRPVVRATLLGQKALHGDVPSLFHAGNLLLAVAMALVARALLLRPALGVAPWLATLGAALFVLHPVASSAVYPVASGRETLLPALLALASVWAWLGGTRAWRAAAALCFAGALFGKEASVTVPAVLLLADVLRLVPDAPPPRAPARWLLRYAPVAAVMALYLAIRATIFGGSELRVAVLDDPAGPLRSLGFALQSWIAPPLALAYEPELHVWWSPGRFALAGTVTALLAAAAWRGGEASRRSALFWLGFGLAALLPTANVLRQEAPFDERYAFLALLAPIGVAARGLSAPRARGPLAPPWRRRAIAGAAVALAAVVTLGRAAAFRDDEAFARQWLATDPRSAEAHHALGFVLVRSGETLEGEAHYVQALALNPGFVEAHHNLGSSLAAAGRLAEARPHFETVVRLQPEHPEAHNNLGLVLAAEGDLAAAVGHYERALEIAPAFAEAHNNLATALARQGRLAEALRHLDEALRIAPGYAAAARNREIVRARLAGAR